MLVAKTHFSANKKLMASVQGDNEINLTCLCPRKALPFLRVTVFVAPSIVKWCFQVVVNLLSLVCKCRSTCLAVLDFFFPPKEALALVSKCLLFWGVCTFTWCADSDPLCMSSALRTCGQLAGPRSHECQPEVLHWV